VDFPVDCGSTWFLEWTFFHRARDQTQGLEHFRQVIYRWNTSPTLFGVIFMSSGDPSQIFVVVVCFWGKWSLNSGLALARQVLYCLSHFSSPQVSFKIRIVLFWAYSYFPHWILLLLLLLLFEVLEFELRAYTLSHSTSLVFACVWWVFWDRVSWTVCPGLALNFLLTSVSWVVRITGTSHWCPASWLNFLH
jgi:hypothetical protein